MQYYKHFENINVSGEWFKINQDVKNFVKYLKIREYKENGGIG